MRWKTIAVFLLFAGAIVSFAQDFSADYVQGPVDLQESSGWYGVAIGDSIPADAVIRLGAGAYAEISNGTITVKLSRPGIYRMASLVKGSTANESAGLGSILSQRVEALARSSDNRNTAAVGGVRAEKAPSGPQTMWAGGEDPAELISQGLTLMQQGNYTEAYYRFKDAYDNADSGIAPKASFYAGYAASLRNDTRNALKYLSEYKPDPKSSFYGDQVLTLAQLYVETFAYKDALSLLSGYLAGAPTDQSAQTAYFLQGLAYRGDGDTASARAALLKARDLMPGTSVSSMAAKVLAGM